jgi:hypothetical protein
VRRQKAANAAANAHDPVACDGDIVKALAAYQAEPIPRTALIQQAART